MHKPIKKILILVAMQAEADPIINALKLKQKNGSIDVQLPFNAFEKASDDQEILLIQSGSDPRYKVDNIGTQAATLMAYVGIEHFKPDLVISAGTAGGFSNKGAQIGTVYLSDKEFVFHDRQIPLAGFDEQGVGHYPAANLRGLAKKLDLLVGIISSGSSFKKDEGQLAAISKSGAVAKEMEVAAIGWVCWLKQTPLVAIKSITNLLDQQESSESQFVENFSFATLQLSQKVQYIVEYIRGKTLFELSDKSE